MCTTNFCSLAYFYKRSMYTEIERVRETAGTKQKNKMHNQIKLQFQIIYLDK